MEEKIGLLISLQLFQDYSVLNEKKILLFHCNLKAFKIINSIAADWTIILMGYLSKVYEYSQEGVLITEFQLLYTMTV